MHLAFVDIVYDYTADRPQQGREVGGTTSAICFLAQELTKYGVKCTIYNKILTQETVLGVETKPLDSLIDDRFNQTISAFIFCGRWVEWMAKSIREATKVPLIAWMHESLMVAPLTAPLEVFDGAVFVSEWQKKINQAYVPKSWRQSVIKNGMNPRFLHLFAPDERISAAKTRPFILAYVGVTPRGVFHIPPILDALRLLRTDFTVEIFCNCNPTRDEAINEKYISFMRGLANVTHVGQLGQSLYAEHLKRATLLIAPNPWPETFCVSLVEAMAAGLSVVTTDRAVLPETAAGFAELIAIEDKDHPLRFDQPISHREFAEAIDSTLTRHQLDPENTERHLKAQINYVKEHYQWPQKVRPWLDFIASFG